MIPLEACSVEQFVKLSLFSLVLYFGPLPYSLGFLPKLLGSLVASSVFPALRCGLQRPRLAYHLDVCQLRPLVFGVPPLWGRVQPCHPVPFWPPCNPACVTHAGTLVQGARVYSVVTLGARPAGPPGPCPSWAPTCKLYKQAPCQLAPRMQARPHAHHMHMQPQDRAQHARMCALQAGLEESEQHAHPVHAHPSGFMLHK